MREDDASAEGRISLHPSAFILSPCHLDPPLGAQAVEPGFCRVPDTISPNGAYVRSVAVITHSFPSEPFPDLFTRPGMVIAPGGPHTLPPSPGARRMFFGIRRS